MFKRLRRESQPTTRLVINHDRCLSCGACVAVCPPDALFLHDLHLTVNHQTCTRCDRCPAMCPVHALALVPQETPHHENGL
ncbi:MAG: 4Fe-4S dicluster domain-containing protein [Chloroflexi bacterium]|nr:4Fe-4S dicluster domain-containing protein [Chloroflexota bacterium]